MRLSYNYFDAYEFGGLEFGMTLNDAKIATHPGPNDSDVEWLIANRPYLRKQLSKLSDEMMVAIIEGCGVEDAAEKNREELEMYIVWLAAGDIVEESYQKKRRA